MPTIDETAAKFGGAPIGNSVDEVAAQFGGVPTTATGTLTTGGEVVSTQPSQAVFNQQTTAPQQFDDLPTPAGNSIINNDVFPRAKAQIPTSVTSNVVQGLMNIQDAPITQGLLNPDKAGQRIAAFGSGLAAAPLELFNLPFVASEGVVNFARGLFDMKPEDGFGTKNADAIHQIKRMLTGDISNDQVARNLQTAGSFLGFGQGLNKIVRTMLESKGITTTGQQTAITDAVSGGVFQQVLDSSGSIGGAITASIIPAIVLKGKVPTKVLTPDSVQNQVEAEIVDVLRRVNGATGKASNSLDAASGSFETNLAIASEVPILVASLQAAKSASVDFSIAATNVDNRFISASKRFVADVANDTKGATDEASAILEIQVGELNSVIAKELDVVEQLVANGQLSIGDASAAFGEHLRTLGSAVRQQGTDLYTAADKATKGEVLSQKAISLVRKGLNDLVSLPTVKSSNGIILSPAVRQAESLLSNELGNSGISNTGRISVISGKPITKITPQRKVPLEAVATIRTAILENVRAIKEANGGKSTAMSLRLEDISLTLTKELEKVPELNAATTYWKKMNDVLFSGEIARFLRTDSAGNTKLAPEKTFNTLFAGKLKEGNIKQLKAAVSGVFDKTGEMKKRLITMTEQMFDSSIASKLLDKEKLTPSDWTVWRRANLDTIKSFDKEFGTSLEAKYGNFKSATDAAKKASGDLKELEGIAFSQVGLGNIDKAAEDAMQHGNVKQVIDGMPTESLQKAMALRIGSRMMDFNRGDILAPQRLIAILKDNSQTFISQLGKERYGTIIATINQLNKSVPSGAVLRIVKKRLLDNPDAIKQAANLATAVIGSTSRRGFKIGLVFKAANTSRQVAEAFERAMFDEPTMRRLISIARINPNGFQNMMVLAGAPSANEAIQGAQ